MRHWKDGNLIGLGIVREKHTERMERMERIRKSMLEINKVMSKLREISESEAESE
jgi:hypothetical protein